MIYMSSFRKVLCLSLKQVTAVSSLIIQANSLGIEAYFSNKMSDKRDVPEGWAWLILKAKGFSAAAIRRGRGIRLCDRQGWWL